MFCWWQIAEGFRKRALEGIKVVTYLQEFANVSNLSELSELFRDDDRLAEAAVRAYSHSISTFQLLSCGADVCCRAEGGRSKRVSPRHGACERFCVLKCRACAVHRR